MSKHLLGFAIGKCNIEQINSKLKSAQPTPSQSIDERKEFEDWLEDFKAQHEEWQYADSEAMYFAAWQARANLSM